MTEQVEQISGVKVRGSIAVNHEDCDEFMFAAGWSDGLPLVAPTPVRVSRMLLGTARAPSESLGPCPPMYADVTVEKVAANAVMAGCEPRHLRIVLAAVEAMLSSDCETTGIRTHDS